MTSANQAEGAALGTGSVLGSDTSDITIDFDDDTEINSSTLDSEKPTGFLAQDSIWRSNHFVNRGAIYITSNPARHSVTPNRQSNDDSPAGTLFPPAVAVLQTEGLRARNTVRTKQQKSRLKEQESDVILCVAYVPYAVVSDSAMENMLSQVTEKLHFLDLCFAEYFTYVVDRDPTYARSQLQDIRLRLSKAQKLGSPDSSLDEDPDVNLGDLGHFCEDVLKSDDEARRYKTPGGPKFHVTRCGNRDTLSYLQDALEVPYWRYMLKELGQWRLNSTGIMSKAAMRVVYSAKLELKVALAKVKHQGEMKGLLDNLAPIIKGIEQRISLLDDVGNIDLNGLHDVDIILQESQYLPGYHVTRTSSADSSVKGIATGTDAPWITVTATSMVAVFSCLVLAMPFLVVGFTKAHNKGEVGSTQDADFWFLLGGCVMYTLSSVLVVNGLHRGPFSLVYFYVYLMLGVGLICSIASLILFCHFHSGWSNLVNMFGAMASVWAALIMTQADEQKAGKVKAD